MEGFFKDMTAQEYSSSCYLFRNHGTLGAKHLGCRRIVREAFEVRKITNITILLNFNWIK
jgi:hypothetical protein